MFQKPDLQMFLANMLWLVDFESILFIHISNHNILVSP